MLPSKVRVKLLSEAAGYISVSHVVQRDFSMPELLELLLAVVGRNSERIRQILRAGTVSTGDYRYRWESLELAEQELEGILGTLPGPEPSRPFRPEGCLLIRFRRDHETLDISRESASHKPLFARQSFWDGLLGFFANRVRYSDYSHGHKADVFVSELGPEERTMLESLLPLLRPRGLADRLQQLRPEEIEWLIPR